jgi:hypothetical protein
MGSVPAPLAVWGVLLGVHYLVYKTRTVDESWVDERTADLRSKSYDASHIDSIAERSGKGELARQAGRNDAAPSE